MCPKVAGEANPGEEVPQVGQWWVGVDAVLVVLALRAALLCSAWRVLCSSTVMTPWVTMRHQQGLSEASDSQDSVLISKSFRETLRLSLKRLHWPLTVHCYGRVLGRRAAWGCHRHAYGRRDLPISVGPCM